MNHIPGARAVLLLTLVLAGGCVRALETVPQQLPATAAHVVLSDGEVHPIRVEVARTPRQREIGLMGRKHLAPGHGMLFIYPETRGPDSGFWMYRTRIPLDLAFLDEKGIIVSIRHMEPCPSPVAAACPTYSAGTPYSAALEMKAGYFADVGIGKGDRVVFSKRPGA